MSAGLKRIRSMAGRLFVLAALACPVDAVLAACDTEAGSKVFNKCVACHSLTPGEHRMGPSLDGLMGRRAGSATGFTYSLIMEQSDVVWDEEQLGAFLADPMGFMPGNAMPFAGLKSHEQRTALLCLFSAKNATRDN